MFIIEFNKRVKNKRIRWCWMAPSPALALPLSFLCLRNSLSCSLLCFQVPFIILGFNEWSFGSFGLLRVFSELFGPSWSSSATALQNLGFWAHSGHILGIWARYNAATLPLALQTPQTVSFCVHWFSTWFISFVTCLNCSIRYWKALSMIFTLICNMLYKTFRNLHINLP